MNVSLPVRALVLATALAGLPMQASAQIDRTGAVIFSQYRADSRYDLASQPERGDEVGFALGTGDFNGDGYQDLAIGIPFEDYGSSSSQLRDSGWVSVIYGTPAGLDASPGVEDIPWDQEGEIEGGPEERDWVGYSVATGDFNGDGFDDLAMGSPREDISSTQDAGSVNVIYGSSDGLQTEGNRQFWQGRNVNGRGVPGSSEAGDQFGTSLTAGDFDGDGRDDLAIGVPYEDLESSSGTIHNAGGVVVLYGRPVIGLDPERAQSITRRSSGMDASPSSSDRFGFALAAGDFDGDGRDDLAIGVPHDDHEASNAGAIDIIYGSASGLDLQTNVVGTLDVQGVAGVAQAGDNLGLSLTVGNFDGDSYEDLAAGLPNRDSASTSEHGAALVLYGTASGLAPARSQFLQQGSGGLVGVRSEEDFFAEYLAAGDLDGDGADELIVGVPGENVVIDGATREEAGAAHVIYGRPGSGLTADGNEIVDYSLVGEAASYDYFGWSLALGDFDGDRAEDLAIGVPGREVLHPDGSTVEEAGEVVVVPGLFDGGPCRPDAFSLCLNASRFRVDVEWGGDGAIGLGVPIPRTADTGFFYFFNSDNIELVVKVLDARSVNGHFWVFYGSLSNVAYTLRVTDELTGAVRTYRNPPGTFASNGDTAAFADSSSGLEVSRGPSDLTGTGASPAGGPAGAVALEFETPADPLPQVTSSCQANQLALCLNDERFFVQVNWRDFSGNSGDGRAVPLTNDTGAFWFFDEDNLEVVIKVLDGTDINGHYWVFFGALTNVAYEITVLDTETGQVARYENPAGTFASQGDNTAIPE